MDFGLLPPEINSNRMFHGPGSAPLLAAAEAWDALANALHSAEISVITVMSGLGTEFWQRPSAAPMAEVVGPYLKWIRQAVLGAHHAAAQARSAAEAFKTAVLTVVQPWQISANRNRLRSLAAANQLAQYAPAVAALEANYNEMWARDAAAMYSYARNAGMATRLTPFTLAGIEPIAAESGQRGDKSALTAIQTDEQQYCAVPRALLRLASSMPGSSGASHPMTDSVDAAANSDIPLLMSPMSQVSTLIAKLANADNDRQGAIGRSQAVSAHAWFRWRQQSGAPSPYRTAGGQSGSAKRSDVGPATAIGQLSVPQAWVDKAPPRPAPILPMLVSQFESNPDRQQ